MAKKLTKNEKGTLSRLLRQLAEREKAVRAKRRKPPHYTNKHKAFVEFIDGLGEEFDLKADSRLWKIYHDKWNG